LQGMLAAETNRLHKVLDDAGIRLGGLVSDINGLSARRLIRGLIDGKAPEEIVPHVCGRLKGKIPQLLDALDEPLGERHRFLLQALEQHLCYLEQEISNLDEYLFAAMIPYKRQWEILQTIPGVDAISAVMVLVEIGVDMNCFGRAERLASWAGICPGNNESAGKQKGGRIRKGNQALRRVLCEISNAASKTKSQFRGQYQGLVIRRGHKRAIIAVGHKVLRVVYAMLKSLQPYRDPEIDYTSIVVQRNAPRWIAALKKYGFLPDMLQAD